MFAVLPFVLLLFAAFGGVSLTFYIRHKKGRHEGMVCPLGSDCDAVINSEYSTFLGVPLELLGMVYYAAIAVGYAAVLLVPQLAALPVGLVLFTASFGAFLMSLYLVFIQAFYLKQWCTWCLGSAGLSTTIFGLSLLGSYSTIISLLAAYASFFWGVYVVAIVTGVAVATIGAILFFRFLADDYHISHVEARVLQTMEQIVWVALALVLISGFAVYAPQFSVMYLVQSTLLVEIIALVTLIGISAFLYQFVSAQFFRISFAATATNAPALIHLRRLAFILGAGALFSWYTLLFLALSAPGPSVAWLIVVLYAVLLVIALYVGHLLERRFAQHARTTPTTD